MQIEYYDYFKSILRELMVIDELFPSILDRERYYNIEGQIHFAWTFNLITIEQKQELEYELIELARKEPWYIKEYGEDTKEDKRLRKNLRDIIDRADCEGIKDLDYTYITDDFRVFITKTYEIAGGESSFNYCYTADKDLVLNDSEAVYNDLIIDYAKYVKYMREKYGEMFI